MDPHPTPDVSTEPEGETVEGGSTWARWAMAGALVALVVVVAVVAWNIMSADTEQGTGAESPEAAIEALVAALEASDAEAMIATLVPGERERVDEVVRELLAELGRVGVLSTGIELAAVPGFDFEVIDLSLTSSSVGDGVAMVGVGGTLRTTIFGADLPLGPALTGVLPMAQADIPSPPPAEIIDIRIATVRQDGGWHVSIGHTIAEVQRAEGGWPVPDPSGAIEPHGSDSPEAVAQALLDRVDPLDPAGLIALLNPGEANAAHRHAPTYLQNAAAWVIENDFTIDEIEYGIEHNGDTADIHIDVLAVTTVSENPWDGTVITSSVRFADGCMNAKDAYSGHSENPYLDEPESRSPVPGMTLEADGSVTYCPDEAQGMGMGLLRGGLFGTTGPPTIGLARHEGQWFVSPARTFANGLLHDLRAIPDGGGTVMFEGLLTSSVVTYSG